MFNRIDPISDIIALWHNSVLTLFLESVINTERYNIVLIICQIRIIESILAECDKIQSQTKLTDKFKTQTNFITDKVTWTFHDKTETGTWFDSRTKQINIEVGLYYSLSHNNITDDEIIELMTKEIEHEVIHCLIDAIADLETNQRFDLVAYGIYGERFLWLLKNVLKVHIRTKEETREMYWL